MKKITDKELLENNPGCVFKLVGVEGVAAIECLSVDIGSLNKNWLNPSDCLNLYVEMCENLILINFDNYTVDLLNKASISTIKEKDIIVSINDIVVDDVEKVINTMRGL